MGRRNALRYLGGELKAQTLVAFAKDTRTYESDQDHRGRLVVRGDGSRHTTQWGGIAGEWQYNGGVVSLLDGSRESDALTVGKVPETIAAGFSRTLPLASGWAEVGGDGDLDVQVTKDTIRLTFGGGQRVITCTRA
ncbi:MULTISPECIES: hypothetical protein [Kitasatospora]|uniref:Uncharacterized protein n=1 Tax=Kitasatospora setae (strain ATCC 33774 / DSM 43861 / JCM 3304 / KCC A-0304 / NBRC 14216 / KM-6054) TaxID=452652 RepID=E4N209_KITSK|nr:MULTISPECIES: hypothetical protein [Kitasatospora]BAJ32193.1 hypothetical protein KSE_64340 [Kitasatospora setae KM-6054]